MQSTHNHHHRVCTVKPPNMYGANKRERTPLSPSPSPEPQNGAERNSTDGGTGFKPLSIGGTSGLTSVGGELMGTEEIESTYGDPKQENARRILEDRIRFAVDHLMQLATCAADVHEGDEDIVRLKINETMESLQGLQDACNLPDLKQMVPEDVVGMIDVGRNPDIHTRTFTNRLNSDNQQMRGQALNFDKYRDRLRDKLGQAFPEMQSELEQVDREATQ